MKKVVFVIILLVLVMLFLPVKFKTPKHTISKFSDIPYYIMYVDSTGKLVGVEVPKTAKFKGTHNCAVGYNNILGGSLKARRTWKCGEQTKPEQENPNRPAAC